MAEAFVLTGEGRLGGMEEGEGGWGEGREKEGREVRGKERKRGGGTGELLKHLFSRGKVRM